MTHPPDIAALTARIAKAAAAQALGWGQREEVMGLQECSNRFCRTPVH